MNVTEMMEWTVRRAPEKTAIVEDEKRFSYREWSDRADRLAGHLARMGVGKGDRVACMLKTCEEHATTFFALQKLGAVAVPFNFRTKKEGLAYHVDDSGAKMLFFDGDFAEEVMAARELMPACNHYVCVGHDEVDGALPFEDLLQEEALPVAPPEVNGDDLSMILYTSGTAGPPKGVPLTHEASVARALGIMVNHGQQHLRGDRVIGLMPLFHTVGIHTVLLGTVFANGIYYPVREFSPPSALNLIEKERITHVFGTPTHFQAMLSHEELSSYDTTSVEHVLYAGAPMAGSLVKRCAEELTTENVTLIYGNTETYNSLFMRHTHRRPGAAVCGVLHDVRVVRLGGSTEEAPPGEEGELVVNVGSPESFRGYWNKPQETEKKVRDGWYYTGDACLYEVEDQQPLYTVTGRLDDMIISGGENIHPGEIEDLLFSHSWVDDVAVAGADDTQWGQLVKAFVVKKDPNLTAEQLDDFFKESHLENYKRPRAYEFIAEIPRNPSGKTLRHQLGDLSGDRR